MVRVIPSPAVAVAGCGACDGGSISAIGEAERERECEGDPSTRGTAVEGRVDEMDPRLVSVTESIMDGWMNEG